MIEHSEAYAAAVVADSRRQYVRAVFDLVDPDLVITGVSATSEAAFSRTQTVVNRGTDESSGRYVTLEKDRWALDGTWEIMPDDPAQQVGQIGLVSEEISGATGDYSTPVTLEIDMSGVDVLQAVSFRFSEYGYNGVPDTFSVALYSGASLLLDRTVEGNRSANVVVDGFTVYYPTKLLVTVSRWSEPFRRARIPRVMVGLYETWDTSIVQTVDIYTEVSFSGLAMPFSSCSLTVENRNHRFDPYAPNSLFQSIEDRQAVSVELGMQLADGSVEWLPGGTYFQQSAGWSLQDLTITWELVDIIGALVKRRFVVPSTLPTTLGGWLGAILGSLGVNFQFLYIVDTETASIALTASREAVSGMSCGDLLRFLCMATNTWARQDFPSGKVKVSKLERLEGNRITLDNMETYPVMSANEDIADITFKLDSGEVTFPGNNTESEVSLSVDNPFVHTSADAQKAVVSCLFQYGGRSFDVSHRGNPSSECGDIQAVDTQFESTISARLYKQQLKLDSGVMLDVPSLLVQSPNDSMYENKLVLTGAGSWTAPASGPLKITVIGGGTGGMGGGGGNMQPASGDRYEDTDGGTGGDGGRVFIVEVTAVSGQSYAYSCGTGGTGGAGGLGSNSGRGQAGTPGTAGTATTFGVFSSENGGRYAAGIMDIQTGAVYAQSGADYGGAISGLYGSGGAGGRQGTNGKKMEVLDDFGHYRTYTARHSTDGTAGLAGLAGCVVLEW